MGTTETLLLQLMHLYDPIPNLPGRLIFHAGVGQIIIPHCRHFYAQINAIQQRLTQLVHMTLNGGLTASTLAHVGIISTIAGIHGCHQHKIGGKTIGAVHSGNGHLLVLHGLTQHLQCALSKFRQFIQKKDTRLPSLLK